MRLLLPLLVTLGCSHATRATRAPAAGEPVLEVLTYNVNFGIPGDAATVGVLESSTAGLVLLQETTPQWQSASSQRLSLKWPHQTWLHAPGAGGLAVLSRSPFEVKDVLKNPAGWFPSMRVVAQTPLGPVQALIVHLRPPVSDSGSWVSGYLTTGPARRAEVEHFLGSLDPSLPTLIAGDFNEGTGGEAVRELERRKLRSVLPEFAPDAKTWGWDVGALHLSAQLDHIVYSTHLEPLTARVVAGGRSDHQAVMAVFARSGQQDLVTPTPRGGSLSFSLR
ncbi:MAG: endonuclease/exonuclease/phosphatase family protein [Myxococcaceae bacterium]|nr:endonuclease/exonuclease/phosphatase family protein [Myxococcaceae bacterium]